MSSLFDDKNNSINDHNKNHNNDHNNDLNNNANKLLQVSYQQR